MYRNRARAAHKLQSQVPVQAVQQEPQQQPPVQQQPGFDNQQQQYGGYNQQQPGWDNQGQQQQQPEPQAVPFFNPSQYQNGTEAQPPMEPAKTNGTAEVNQNQYNGSGVADWQNQNKVTPDQNHNHNLQYNLNQNQVAEEEPEYNQNHLAQQQIETASAAVEEQQQQQPTAEVTLDPSGQWYWDYQQQQWFPYYPPQPAPAESQLVTSDSIENITQGIQQLTTAAIADNQIREPSQENQYSQQQQYSLDLQQQYGQDQQQGYVQDQQPQYGQEQQQPQQHSPEQQQLHGLDQNQQLHGQNQNQQLPSHDQQQHGHDQQQHGHDHRQQQQYSQDQQQQQYSQDQQLLHQHSNQQQLPGQDQQHHGHNQQQLPVQDQQQHGHDQKPQLSHEHYQQFHSEEQRYSQEPHQPAREHHLQNGEGYPQVHDQHQEQDGRRSSQVSDIGSQASWSDRRRPDSQMSDTRRQDSLVSDTVRPPSQMSDIVKPPSPSLVSAEPAVEAHVAVQPFSGVAHPWIAPPPMAMSAVAAPPETAPPMGFSSFLAGAPMGSVPPPVSVAPPLSGAPPQGVAPPLTGAPPEVAQTVGDLPMAAAPPMATTGFVAAAPPSVTPISSPQSAPPVGDMVVPCEAPLAVAPPPLANNYGPASMAVASFPAENVAPPPMAVYCPPHILTPPPVSDPSPLLANPPSLGPPDLVDHRPNTSQPELVSDIPHNSSQGSPHHQPLRSVPPPDMFASLPSGPEHIPAPQSGPDLTSQSVIHSPHSVSSPSLVSHDQHYEFYSQAYSNSQHQSVPGQGMPDVTGGQQGGGGHGAVHVQPVLAQHVNVKAPDILRTESVPPAMSSVPSSDRNLFMETGELMEEDAVRVSHEPPPLHSPHSGPQSFPQMSMMGAASLPPMVGGNEHYEQSGPPLMRLVVGESHSTPTQAPPHRLVEGDTAHPQLMPVSREVEGESHPAPSPVQQLYSSQPQLPREPLEGESEPPQLRIVPGLQYPPPSGPPPSITAHHPPSLLSVQVPPVDHSAPHQSPAEARSEAAGSDRRDVDVMGGPPPQVRPAPLPTPGRDITGEESQSGGGGAYRRDTRDPYDSEDDRDRDSDSGDRRYGHNRNRRTVSPGARSGHHKPARVMERSYRSSTDREDGDRRYGSDRREDDRRQKKGGERDKDHRSYYDRKEERRQREREEEDERRSHRDYRTRPIKREPYDDRNDRSSVYEEDRSYHRPSRPSSRTGSVYGEQDNSFGYRNMSSQWAMLQQQALLQQQYMQQQQMMAVNPLQFQLQTAVAEMEKALDTPSNVMIYKQHWDYYGKAPALLEKLKVEQPIMHHLLQHFRQNFWHLVEQQMAEQDTNKREGVVSATPSHTTPDIDRPSSAQTGRDEFAAQFHGNSGVEDSSIRAELEQFSNYSVDQASMYESGHTLPARLTPLMFSRPHTCARISAGGLLVKVEPSNPQEGQTATVELHSLAAILRDTQESQELIMFPGPLKPGVTHKNDVIKFCERKIAACRDRRDMADKESYILVWDMMVLLLRQKGQVEGSDLAELLLKDRREVAGQVEVLNNRSRASSHREIEGGTTSSASSVINEEVEVTYTTMDRSMVNTGPSTDTVGKFRSYLLHGNKAEGLEFAMKAGLWGHALFLASKMDQRTYAGVMTRFANGLAINDPLQTLYQLMSARMPSAMKRCADQRWGDWRPHLAMILSNPLPGSDINTKSMITLGDSLLAKGQLYAAQFCYIVSAAEWGTYSNKCAKLVLLLSSVADKNLEQFATTEAIQCTEIYEFVQKLGNKEFEMPYLQPYKYLHCLRLVETGHSTRAQDYARVLADYVTESVASGHVVEQDTVPGWVGHTAYLAEKLKYLDPVYTTSVGEISEIADPDWLVRFREAVTSLQYGAQQYEEQYDLGGYDNYQQGVEGDSQADQQSYPDHSAEQPTYNQEPETFQPDPGYSQQGGFEQQPGGHDQQQGGYDQLQQQSSGYDQLQQPGGYDQQQPGGYDQQQPGGYDQQQPGGYDQQQPGGYDQPQQPPEHSSQLPDQQSSVQSEVPPPLLFNPTEINPNPNSPPTFFNPTSLPPIPEQTTRKSSLTKQGSLSSPTEFNRQNSGRLSRSPSESDHNLPSSGSYYGAVQNSSPPLQKSPEKEKSVEKPAKKAAAAPAAAPKKSWFGGIFSKIMKSDQVHLPDDKDKTIVYDEAKGRWVNLDGEDDDLAPAAPPPMDPAFSSPAAGPATGPSGPPAAPTSYRAGLGNRRGRGYVDVLGQAGLSKPMSTPLLPNGVPPGGMLGSPPSLGGMAPPSLLNPNLAPTSSDGPTSLTTSNPYMVPDGGAGGDDTITTSGSASMPMMMFNPSNMAGAGAEQPPGF
eukprot:GFUD01008070.1.p1 GENE.GFUD01008070.1~~GFUD01008070.1.p1  ORF type:complete len:2334 (+),score=842.22 GFUD01008070.1:46-7047(+)